MFWRELRRLRALRGEVSEELRGWRWDSPPVAPPPLGARLSVSEIANGHCESRRDLYLRRVLRLGGRPTPAMRWGAYLHEVLRMSLSAARRLVSEGVVEGWELLERFDSASIAEEAARRAGAEPDPRAARLARFIALRVAADLDEAASRTVHLDAESLANRVVPVLSEYAVDGSYLGLTSLRADALAYDVVLEVKVGGEAEGHRLALAGYALAIEADLELPIEHGLLVYVNVNHRVSLRVRPVHIGDALRRMFLEARDQAMELVESGRDPGLAPRCPDTCPFHWHCHGAGG